MQQDEDSVSVGVDEHPAAPRLSPDNRKLLRLSGLGTLALLVILITVVVLRSFDTVPETQSTLAPTPTPNPALAPGTGWQHVGDGLTGAPVFAPNDPQTGYLCSPGAGNALQFHVTHDGGKHWDALPSPGKGAQCQVSVNPANAQDVIMLASSSADTSTQQRATMQRSRNGGRAWFSLFLPWSGDARGDFLIGGVTPPFAWSGQSFYALPFDQTRHHLAVSRFGGGFEAVDETDLLRASLTKPHLTGLVGSGTSIFAQGSGPCPDASGLACPTLAQSDDGAQTWQQIYPSARGLHVELRTGDTEGKNLIGLYPGQQQRFLARSSDDGVEWVPLPDFPWPDPVGVFGAGATCLTTPDGSIISMPNLPSGQNAGVYLLAPGSLAWKLLGAAPSATSGPFSVSWDDNGRPVALWGVDAHQNTVMLPVG